MEPRRPLPHSGAPSPAIKAPVNFSCQTNLTIAESLPERMTFKDMGNSLLSASACLPSALLAIPTWNEVPVDPPPPMGFLRDSRVSRIAFGKKHRTLKSGGHSLTIRGNRLRRNSGGRWFGTCPTLQLGNRKRTRERARERKDEVDSSYSTLDKNDLSFTKLLRSTHVHAD